MSTRPTSPEMDAHIGVPASVLDKGFVRVIDYMGTDASVVQAARVSYGEGTKTPSDDRSLIRYLMRHQHTTPFEMCEIKLHVKLPIFVARQWVRHRTASINEVSARYSVLASEFYVPESVNIQKQSTTNKQGRGEGYEPETAAGLAAAIKASSEDAYELYEDFADGGLARETARMVLPTNIYTEWYWKTNLLNLFRFLELRNDPTAQYEIRCYAQAIADIVSDWVPESYQAFEDYRQGAVTFSAQELRVLQEIAVMAQEGTGSTPLGDMLADVGLSGREVREFLTKIAPS